VFLRRKPPAKLRPKLDRSERLLAWATVVGDTPAAVVVTTYGLWLPGRPRLGWHLIHKATWSGSRLTVVPASPAAEPVALDGVSYTVMADDAPVTVALTEPGDVPGAVRQRVTRSVAYTAHHPLPAGGVRVVARRVPGADGLAWHVRYDEGTPTGDLAVAARTAELVTEAALPAHVG
jgi:hypothetical protein